MAIWLKLAMALAIGGLALGLTWWLQPSPRSPPIVPLRPAAPPSATLIPPPPGRDAGVVSEHPSDLPPPDVHNPLSEALCPMGMVWVGGEYCAAGFDGEKGCRVAPKVIAACVDAFEYPNQVGVRPAVMATFAEAEGACAVEGKRLCTDAEWTLACRGTVALSSCAFGRGKLEARRELLWDPQETEREVERVDERRTSSRTGCVSTRGAYDLPGNVEEWTRAQAANGYDAALKGGHFNRGSIGCERSVYTRQLDVRLPSLGFRCCRDPLVAPPVASF